MTSCYTVQITMDTRLIDALTLFVERRVSVLPVVDNDGKLVNAFAKYDTIVSVTSIELLAWS